MHRWKTLALLCTVITLITGCDSRSDENESAIEPLFGNALGDNSIHWQGDWLANTSYFQNDLVAYGAHIYIATEQPIDFVDPPSSGSWTLLNTVGPQGPRGLNGEDGLRGPQGINGERGETGLPGDQGQQGPPGIPGIAGATGAQGPAGNNGADGADGSDGMDGETGATWQGDWQSGVSYAVNDIAGYNGAAYIAIQNTTGTEVPTNILFWDILAQSRNTSTLAGGSESGYEFVGFSNALVTGGVGLRGMNEACQTDFGSTSRQASSSDIFETPQLISKAGVAWVRAISHPSSRIVDINSGLAPTLHNCSGWASTAAETSLAINGPDHSFTTATCNVAISVACVGPTDDRGPYEYVGFSSSQVAGNAGFKGMNDACQADYGVNARLVTSEEIVESLSFPLQTGGAWVMPSSHNASRNFDKVSGLAPSLHACQGYSANNSNTSLIINGDDHSFGVSRCNQLRYVACGVPREDI